MSRIALALLLLTFAVAGLAVTVRAQQEPPPQEESQAQQEPPPEEASQPQPEPSMSPCPPDRILVKVQPGVDASTVIGRYGGTIIRTIEGIEVHVVNVPAGTGQQAIDALNADPEVKYAEPDAIVRAAAGESGASCP